MYYVRGSKHLWNSQPDLGRLNKNLWDMGLFFIWCGGIIEDFGVEDRGY